MASQSRNFNLLEAANDEDLTPVLQQTILSLVQKEGADLTARQLGIFLTVYLDDGPHTVRSLAMLFGICKPAVTRALDRLGDLEFARRKVDPRDRRSVLVHRTDRGWAFMGELRRGMARAVREAEWTPAPRAGAARAWRGSATVHAGGFGQSPAANPRPD